MLYKICFYVPATHVDIVKNAMFEKGAGQVGNYRCCAWQVLGEGQYFPMEGSDPFIGQVNQLQKEPEYKVEMICASDFIDDVILAFRQTHPYEEPGYDVIVMENY
jgi:structural hemagglutinin/hemolysin toxin protein RtxA